MDLNSNELVGNLLSSSIENTKGIASQLYNKYQKKFVLPEKYLSEQIIKNKELSNDDLFVAAQLYGVSKLRRQYKNISKIIYSADNIAALKGIKSGEIDDDWMSYFLNRAENISNETVQNIFAYILSDKLKNKNGFKKVMLDRLALLDYESASAFLKLCQTTYQIYTSEQMHYSIPFYIRDSILKQMVDLKDITFSDEDAINYQNIRPKEDDLEILQEIGLIKLSEDVDECDIYSSNDISFTIDINGKFFQTDSIFDDFQKVYYLVTGCCTFTVTGLELYNALKEKYLPNTQLFNIIDNYYKYQKHINNI